MNANRFLKYITLCFFAVFIISCGQIEEESDVIPDTVLDKEKFIQVLLDFSLAESATNLNIKNLSGSKFDSAYAFNPLKENNISRALYDSSLSFYSRNPKLFKKIYEEVLVRLSNMQVQREAKKDSIVKRDSLAKNDSLAKVMSVLSKKAGVKNDSVTKKAEVKNPKRKRRIKNLKK